MSTLLSASYPTLDALDETAVAAARARIVGFLNTNFPDLDTSPGSVYGDLIVTAEAWRLAALEKMVDSLLADTDLASLQNGTVQNCDFVAGFLKTLGVLDAPNANSSGVLRLYFLRSAEDSPPAVIDRGTAFLANESDLFYPVLAAGVQSIIASDRPFTTSYWAAGLQGLAPYGGGVWVLDVPVVGTLTAAVTAGTAFKLDRTIPGLRQAVALTDFSPGNPTETLKQKAARAVSLFHAVGAATRMGVAGLALRQLSLIKTCSPVLTGDREMIRDTTNVLGFSDGRVDAYARGQNGLLQDSIVVPLRYEQVTGRGWVYAADVTFPSPPMVIQSVTIGGAALAPTTGEGDGYHLVSCTTDAKRGIYGAVAGSAFERFTLAVVRPWSELNPAPYTPSALGGDRVVYATVNFLHDPASAALERVLGDRDYAPAGVDIMARAEVPVVISSLKLKYRRRRSSSVNLGLVTQEIVPAVNDVSYPDLLSTSRINDSLLYAGAEGLYGFEANAQVWATCATHFMLPAQRPASDAGWIELLPGGTLSLVEVAPDVLSDVRLTNEGSGLTLGAPLITSIETLRPTRRDPSRFIAYGPRNLRYVLTADAITYTELVS